jgi:hypothetical protein
MEQRPIFMIARERMNHPATKQILEILDFSIANNILYFIGKCLNNLECTETW